MSIFKSIVKSLASESGELKKIRMESEQRRTVKPVSGAAKAEQVIDKTIDALIGRIDKNVKAK